MWMFASRTVTRLASAAGLLALVAGVPYGQLRYLGWPIPGHLPTAEQMHAALTSRDWLTDATLVNGLSLLLWLLWLLFVVSLAVEVSASSRGVRAPRYHLLAPTQGIAAALVAGLTATIVATAPAPALTHAPSLPAAPAAGPAAAVFVAPGATPTVVPTRVDAVALKPAGAVTLLIKGQPHEHKVANNESLWSIADTYLDDPNRWPEIWQLNKGRYWPHVSGRTTFHNPDLIFPGWVLTLPADASVPPDASPTPPPQTPPADTTTSRQPAVHTTPSTGLTAPRGSPSTAGATPSATAPAGTGIAPPSPVTTTASPAVTTSPSNSPTTAGTPSTATPTASSSAGHDEPAMSDTPGWIQVAGGFIAAGLAAGLLYAVAMVWKRRRYVYQPTPITTPVLEDPDLTPPLGALTHIRQSLRRHAPDLLDRAPNPGPTVREYTTAEAKPPLPPVGPTGTDLAGVGTLPVAVGLGLTGPAALDAARALLVATLTAGKADDPDAQGQAIVPAGTLATLLGVSAVDLGPMRRLAVTPSFADALTLVEEEIIRRSRVIADHEAADVSTLRETEPLAEPVPQLLLIADVPDESWHARLATAVRLGRAVDIGAVLIGDWPHGTTLAVAADGTTADADTPRVAVLDTAASSEILTMLREAHGDAVPPTATTHSTGHNDASPPPAPTAETPSTVDSHSEAAEPAPPATTAPAHDAAQSDCPVHVRVLGSPAILGTDGEPVRGLRAKSLELLVYLAVHRRGAALDDIMEAIWGDATPRRAAERLSTCVGNLRGVIRTVAQTTIKPTDSGPAANGSKRPPIEPVVNTGGHYHLDPAVLQVDWWTVLDQYAQVATASDDAARLHHLHVAIASIGGGLAGGADYDWIDTDREHTRRYTIKIYAQAAASCADTDPHQARVYSDQACQLDPLSDELARRAMHAAARVGDADAIRDRLSTLRRDLDDAGIDLDPATEQLAATLLRQLANP
jgi:two-component SAPR family response regulator